MRIMTLTFSSAYLTLKYLFSLKRHAVLLPNFSWGGVN